jgi:PAS domain S-box-containing protein
LTKKTLLHTAHLSSLFEHSTEGIILTRGDGPVVLVNPAAERMFGYAADEIIGKPIERLIPQRYQTKHIKLREGFYNNPQNRVMGHGRDLYGRKKNGQEFPVEVSLSFYRKDDDLFVIAFIVDITQRKKTEQEILQQQKELQRMAASLQDLNRVLEQKVEERTTILKEALQKLEKSQAETQEALQKEKQLNEIKSRFMSIASHEFRTPLSTVLSSASLLSKYATTEEHLKRERHIEKIKSSVRSLNGILEDFLSLGKLEEGKITIHAEEFDIDEFMFLVVEEMNPLLKTNQHLSVNHRGLSKAVSDKRLIKNILINLITNAIKFSDEGTTVHVNVSVTRDATIFEVIDEGIGIPQDELDHLFSSFYRARNAVNIQGTGLGLHIVKRYLELLQANIDVETEVGKGSKFTIQIPHVTD